MSASVGIDFADDGRALAVTDWDGDGDLDLWVRNRSGPQLRFMRNDGADDHHFIQFRLQGATCNRDAIGATVEVQAGERRLIRPLLAGDSYLAQSSKLLHFGLGSGERVDNVRVRWPGGGVQDFPSPDVDQGYLIVQDNPKLTALPKRDVKINCAELPTPQAPSTARLLLKEPLPLPPSLAPPVPSGSRSVVLINLWAKWCAACGEELSAFSAAAQRLDENRITVVALNLDEDHQRSAATDFFNQAVASKSDAIHLQFADPTTRLTLETILQYIRHRPSSAPLPTSLLVDPGGQLQIVYLGPISVEQLIADAQTYGHHQVPFHQRMVYPGRWYSKPMRHLPMLAAELRNRGCVGDAGFYERLASRRP